MALPRRSRRPLAAALAVGALSALSAPGATAATPPVIAVAGDIACAPGSAVTPAHCQQAATASLISARSPNRVIAPGDIQYDSGATSEFTSFDASWGQFKGLVAPAPGNHDYGTPGAAGYFSYFGAAAGDPSQGFYSFDLGSWHIISLNSNCAADGTCSDTQIGTSEAQVQWLKSDLAAHPGACTLAFWHHPLIGDGNGGPNPSLKPLWDALYAHGADLVLNGHDHAYERFVPLDPAGASDPTRGVTEMVVGTGGEDHIGLTYTPATDARLVMAQDTAFGASFITLQPDRFTWDYREIDGTRFDSGETLCHHPAATFTVAPGAPQTGTPATFDATGTTDPYATALTSYAWDFGDGSTGSGPRPTHTYSAAGAHGVRLTVTNAGGATGVAQSTVVVANPPPPAPPAPAPASAPASASAPPAAPPLALPSAFPAASPHPLRLTGFSMLRHRFRLARGRRVAAGRGTVFRYALSAPATVRIRITRAEGRRRVVVGTILVGRARHGVTRTAFTGRLGRGRLRPARYVAAVIATDAAGRRTREAVLVFRVLRG